MDESCNCGDLFRCIKCYAAGLIERKTSESNRQTSTNTGSGNSQFPTYPTHTGTGPDFLSYTIQVARASELALENSYKTLPRETRKEGVIAWKTAKLSPTLPTFEPLFANAIGRYGIEEKAKCDAERIVPTHSVPGIDVSKCVTCGFYGYKDRPSAQDHKSMSAFFLMFVHPVPLGLLQVEFFGTIVEHTDGYRAEYQRVLKVMVPLHFKPLMSEAELSGWYGTEVERCNFP